VLLRGGRRSRGSVTPHGGRGRGEGGGGRGDIALGGGFVVLIRSVLG